MKRKVFTSGKRPTVLIHPRVSPYGYSTILAQILDGLKNAY
jgi:hypothetical protein